MMKRSKLIYALMLAVALPLMTACSSDDAAKGETPTPTDDLVTDDLAEVRIHLSVAGTTAPSMQMRAYSDDAALTDEMMNVWTVVAVDKTTKKVAFIHAAKPSTEKREVDDLAQMTPGTYIFYSFANMAPSVVCNLMGITGYGKGSQQMRDGNDGGNDGSGSDGGNNGNGNGDPAGGADEPQQIPNYNDVYANDPFMSGEATSVDNNVYDITFTPDSEVDEDAMTAKTVGIDGNGFDISTTNVFGATGIPMSNKQEITITGSSNVELVVVRMFAKVELRLYNETTSDIKVKSATLSDVTLNYNDNIKILPSLSHPDDMASTHKDIQPNLGNTWVGDYTNTPSSVVEVPANTPHTGSAYKTISFYINESAKPTNGEGLFYLTLEMDNSGASEYRYALISNDASEWDYIARNDYRIIPIVLDDLKFEIIPYDFPAIGVYPVSVKELDTTNHLYEFEFHDYGHFHLLPVVTKGGVPVEFSDDATPSGSDYLWQLVDNNWSKSWFTASTLGGAWLTTTTAIEGLGFYRTGYTTDPPVDADEVGGVPVWYKNDGVDGPQWAPDATNYRPFVFGYIEDPGSATKKQVYHEMKIQVYNGSSVYRQMLYRFYMTLSEDQMLYSRQFGAPRVRHTHGY